MLFSAVFRAKARAALKQHWQTALLIALVVSLPSLLVQGLAAYTHTDLMTRVEDLVLDVYVHPEAANSFTDSLRALLSESGVLLMSALAVLAWLVTPALSIGMGHWILERLRGQELPVSAVFSRLRIFHKSIGLRLFIVFKVFLWMLPGIAVTAASVIPVLTADRTYDSLVSAANTSTSIIYAGTILMFVLAVMGYLYYAMADFILADEPGERILSCARRSKVMMKGFRGRLFSLVLSFILWYLVIVLAASFIAGIAGSVMALVAEMLGGLFLSVYVTASEGAFYEALRHAPAQESPAEEPPVME